jgi:hypothetical protein
MHKNGLPAGTKQDVSIKPARAPHLLSFAEGLFNGALPHSPYLLFCREAKALLFTTCAPSCPVTHVLYDGAWFNLSITGCNDAAEYTDVRERRVSLRCCGEYNCSPSFQSEP